MRGLEPGLESAQRLFASEQLLTLLRKLTLNANFDVLELLFLAAQLIFLETNGLRGEVFWEDALVRRVRVRVDRATELLGSVVCGRQA